MKQYTKRLAVLLLGGLCFGQSSLHAEEDQPGARPAGMTLSNFQQGPHNRWAFSHIREILPTANIPHEAASVQMLEGSPALPKDVTIPYGGKDVNLDALIREQYGDGILVMKDGKRLVEGYYSELSADKPHLMMSMSKSVVAVLAGIYADKGILDLSKSVAHYLPEMKGSGWGPDSIRSLLDMKDGADFTQAYDDMTSTMTMEDCAAGWRDDDHCPEGGPSTIYEFLPTVKRNEENAGKFIYKSGSTDVVAWVLERVSGKPLATLITEHIWQPMGAEFDANIAVDKGGFAYANGGMSATLRDMGRFGQMVLNRGRVDGKQMAPKAFFDDAMSQGRELTWPSGDSWYGPDPYYRSFFWGVGNGEGDLNMLGIHGQIVHIAPEANMVIVLFSTWPEADPYDGAYGWEISEDVINAIIAKYRDAQ
jgi:CubicO group peptidase (beta-lactamase class C family)